MQADKVAGRDCLLSPILVNGLTCLLLASCCQNHSGSRRRSLSGDSGKIIVVGCPMDLITLISVKLSSNEVGRDAFGNRYYEERRARPGKPPRRYVRYNGMSEASKVPADWHGWLHHTEASPPPEGGYLRHDWQQDHQPNTTGTSHAHRPAGHLLKGGKRAAATGDYEPWTPS